MGDAARSLPDEYLRGCLVILVLFFSRVPVISSSNRVTAP